MARLALPVKNGYEFYDKPCVYLNGLAWELHELNSKVGVWEGLRFVIVALPGLFSYLFFFGFGQGINTVNTFCVKRFIESRYRL